MIFQPLNQKLRIPLSKTLKPYPLTLSLKSAPKSGISNLEAGTPPAQFRLPLLKPAFFFWPPPALLLPPAPGAIRDVRAWCAWCTAS